MSAPVRQRQPHEGERRCRPPIDPSEPERGEDRQERSDPEQHRCQVVDGAGRVGDLGPDTCQTSSNVPSAPSRKGIACHARGLPGRSAPGFMGAVTILISLQATQDGLVTVSTRTHPTIVAGVVRVCVRLGTVLVTRVWTGRHGLRSCPLMTRDSADCGSPGHARLTRQRRSVRKSSSGTPSRVGLASGSAWSRRQVNVPRVRASRKRAGVVAEPHEARTSGSK